MIKYYKSYHDKSGYTYSIDNVVIEYHLGIGNKDKLIENIKSLSEKYQDNINEYWERLNCPLCSKYQYFETHIHLRDGIYLMIGKWVLFDDKKDRVLFPLIRLDVNPNKHYDKNILNDLLDLIKEDVADWYFKRLDLAIDINLDPKNIQVFRTRKSKGLYKGTRYYSTHGENGFCKIYNKKIESKLDFDCTRVEHTIKLDSKTQKIEHIINKLSLEEVYIKSEDKESIKLFNSAEAIKQLVLRCKASGIEYDDILDKLNYRTRKDILNSLEYSSYNKLEYDLEIIRKLLNDMLDLFTAKKIIEEDENGFLQITKDIDLPFD